MDSNRQVKQWGNITSLSEYRATISFPIAFTTLFSVVGIGVATVYSDAYNDYIDGYSNTSFVWRGRGSQRAFWMAIGK